MRPVTSSSASSAAAAAALAAASWAPSEIPGEEEEGAPEDAASSEEEEGEAEAAELSEEEDDAPGEVESPEEGEEFEFQSTGKISDPYQHVNSRRSRSKRQKMEHEELAEGEKKGCAKT